MKSKSNETTYSNTHIIADGNVCRLMQKEIRDLYNNHLDLLLQEKSLSKQTDQDGNVAYDMNIQFNLQTLLNIFPQFKQSLPDIYFKIIKHSEMFIGVYDQLYTSYNYQMIDQQHPQWNAQQPLYPPIITDVDNGVLNIYNYNKDQDQYLDGDGWETIELLNLADFDYDYNKVLTYFHDKYHDPIINSPISFTTELPYQIILVKSIFEGLYNKEQYIYKYYLVDLNNPEDPNLGLINLINQQLQINKVEVGSYKNKIYQYSLIQPEVTLLKKCWIANDISNIPSYNQSIDLSFTNYGSIVVNKNYVDDYFLNNYKNTDITHPPVQITNYTPFKVYKISYKPLHWVNSSGNFVDIKYVLLCDPLYYDLLYSDQLYRRYDNIDDLNSINKSYKIYGQLNSELTFDKIDYYYTLKDNSIIAPIMNTLSYNYNATLVGSASLYTADSNISININNIIGIEFIEDLYLQNYNNVDDLTKYFSNTYSKLNIQHISDIFFNQSNNYYYPKFIAETTSIYQGNYLTVQKMFKNTLINYDSILYNQLVLNKVSTNTIYKELLYQQVLVNNLYYKFTLTQDQIKFIEKCYYTIYDNKQIEDYFTTNYNNKWDPYIKPTEVTNNINLYCLTNYKNTDNNSNVYVLSKNINFVYSNTMTVVSNTLYDLKDFNNDYNQLKDYLISINGPIIER